MNLLNKLKNIALLVVALMFVAGVNAQVTVSGIITDADDGSTIPGVNIVEKGTSNGTITDLDGNYTITVSSASATLVFSYVGYISQEIPVGAQSSINVALVGDITQLSEVVVIGYGEQEKGDVTGVIAAVDEETFNKGLIVSPDQLIAGKVAGVQITANTGEPGAQNSIRIRGGTSVNASNEPLYVIDGVPIDNSPANPGGFSKGRNPLNFLNPNDIETFTVLKDASAAAIYGSRAANGVIIITTKKGTPGQGTRVTYDGWVSVADAIDKVPVLTGPEFADVVNTVAPSRSDLLLTANTDWQAQVLQTAIGHNHNIGISGATEKSGFRLSFSYLDQEGIIRTSSTERASIGLNFNTSVLDDNLKINTNIKGSATDDRFSPGGAIGNGIGFIPTSPVLDASSIWGGYWEWPESRFGNAVGTNPVGELEQVEETGDTYRSVGNIQLDYQTPLEGLKANLNLGYDVQLGERRSFKPSTVRSQAANNGEARIENFTRTSQLLEFYLNYSGDLDGIQSTYDVSGGYSYQEFNNSFPSFVVTDLPSDAFGFNNPGVAGTQSANNSVLENRLISFWGRVNFALKDKYLLTATVRRDGSTRFSEENRWGVFPSAAFKWRILDEDFMSGLRGSLLDDLGLRIGWGINGNQEIGDYRYLSVYDPSDAFARPQFGNDFPFTIRPSGVDTELKWEETTQLNIGLDFSLFEGRLFGSLEYYNKKTEDLLFEAPVPALTNLKNIILTNVGELENNGFEVQLSSVVLDKGDWNIDLGFNIAYNKNELTKLNGNTDPNFLGLEVGGIAGGVGNTIQLLSVGDPVFTYFVFEHRRDANGDLERDTNPDGTPRSLTEIYVDQNGDDIIDNSDKVKTESPFPDWILGLTGNARYKNWDLNFTFRGSIGNYAYNNIASSNGNFSRVISDITPGNMHRSVLRTGFTEPQLFSDFYLEDASYLRLDNITLGYTVPNEKLNLRLYGTIQNAFVITGYSGLDPELGNTANDSNPNAAAFGVDNNVFPRSRAFVFGVSIGL